MLNGKENLVVSYCNKFILPSKNGITEKFKRMLDSIKPPVPPEVSESRTASGLAGADPSTLVHTLRNYPDNAYLYI